MIDNNRPDVPPPQQNLQAATDEAVRALRGQSAEQLAWLGATAIEDAWRLPVLGAELDVDIASGTVRTREGVDVTPKWRILALHYLGVTVRPVELEPTVTFADLPAGRVYAGIYGQRVIGRLCGTAGRDLATLGPAMESLGARPAAGGDAAFDIHIFPRVPVRLIWYAADDEFPPSATLLLSANIEQFLCAEDIVVMSESLVARLSGRPF